MNSGNNLVGRIIFVNKGNYNSNTQYSKLDIVRYNGKNFISKINNNTGNIPFDDGVEDTNDPYWQLLANSGSYVPSVQNGILV